VNRRLLLIVGVMVVAGCSRAWIDAARDSVDALNAATTIAWQEYSREAGGKCAPSARQCAKKFDAIEQCQDYQNCMRAMRNMATAVIGFHAIVEQSRRVFDALEDDPENAANGAKAKQLWGLVLKHAGALADALAGVGVALEVPK